MRSNCLFEALKAKIKNPKGVRVFKVPHDMDDGFHFMWKEGDFYCHAYTKDYEHQNHFLFEFKIKKIPDYVYESYVVNLLLFESEKVKRRVNKALGMKFCKMKGKWDWSLAKYNHETQLPKQSDIEYYEKVLRQPLKFKVCVKGKLKTMTLEQMKKIKTNFEWKFIEFFDPDFEVVYRYSKGAELKELQD